MLKLNFHFKCESCAIVFYQFVRGAKITVTVHFFNWVLEKVKSGSRNFTYELLVISRGGLHSGSRGCMSAVGHWQLCDWDRPSCAAKWLSHLHRSREITRLSLWGSTVSTGTELKSVMITNVICWWMTKNAINYRKQHWIGQFTQKTNLGEKIIHQKANKIICRM